MIINVVGTLTIYVRRQKSAHLRYNLDTVICWPRTLEHATAMTRDYTF